MFEEPGTLETNVRPVPTPEEDMLLWVAPEAREMVEPAVARPPVDIVPIVYP